MERYSNVLKLDYEMVAQLHKLMKITKSHLKLLGFMVCKSCLNKVV